MKFFKVGSRTINAETIEYFEEMSPDDAKEPPIGRDFPRGSVPSALFYEPTDEPVVAIYFKGKEEKPPLWLAPDLARPFLAYIRKEHEIAEIKSEGSE